MPINTKLVLCCLAFAIMVATLGLIQFRSDGQVRALVEQGYRHTQDALASLHDARREAADLQAKARAPGRIDGGSATRERMAPEELDEALAAITEDVRTARSKAISGDAIAATERLVETFARLQATNGDITRRLLSRELAAAEEPFGAAFAFFQTDADLLSEQILAGLDAGLWQDGAGLGLGLAAVVLLGFSMSRLFVGRIREGAGIARAIAGGDFGVPIPKHSVREIDELFAALKDVRSSISSNSARQERKLLVQAHSFDHTIEAHQHRFAAALNNMSQGLCMLDANLNLLVFNEPFSKIFPHFKLGASSEDVMADPRLHRFLAPHDTGSFVHETADGDILQVKRRSVRGGGLVITFENITEQYAVSKRLEHLAGHDGLTDLPNRRQFRERLQAALIENGRIEEIAVFCLDLNGFKTVNDTYGHPVGDALLKAVSKRLGGCVGPAELVARLGGDEFAILQTEGDQPMAVERLCEEILKAFVSPFEIEGRRVDVGVSIGVALASESGGRSEATADTLMQNCDLALYRAKTEARSSYQLYRPKMRQQLKLRREMETDLRLALERSEFELFYQPFVDVERCCISGFEALLRWRHPGNGLVSPALFIPIAEELGLIREIGNWALREACAQAALWPEALTVSVNLSPVQFRNKTLVAEVADALHRSGLSASRLQLEVTESLFLDKTDDILSILTALRDQGAVISMDDFGTGYSSLGYLTRFPFDKIKIDQSFVRDIAQEESMAVIRAVIGLSRSMKMSVIAEGIETVEQFRMLQSEGCREMQGYLFSKPRPSSELAKLLVEVADGWDALVAAEPARARAA